tara:strand:- start:744 stop:854 length:111 start_codon:yes stop_codon:yes gene_type:complete
MLTDDVTLFGPEKQRPEEHDRDFSDTFVTVFVVGWT